MNLKDKINGSARWLRHGSVVLALTVFIIAQADSSGKKTERINNNVDRIDRVENHQESLKEDIQQIQLDIKEIQTDTKNTKEDVAEIKADQKEIIELLYQIKNK